MQREKTRQPDTALIAKLSRLEAELSRAKEELRRMQAAQGRRCLAGNPVSSASHAPDSLTRLASGVAHDFNNLLTVITGYGNLLLQEVEDSPVAMECLDEILRASDRASSLCQQLLFPTARRTHSFTRLDLNAVVGGVVPTLKGLLPETIRLAVSLHPDLRPIQGDSIQIQQIIMNLAMNGREAIAGEGELVVTTANADLADEDTSERTEMAPNGYVTVSVADTGTGIADDVLPLIFEPYFTTKGRGNGAGLGLFTVHRIVEQNRGEIRVSTERGKGTVFEVYLPASTRP